MPLRTLRTVVRPWREADREPLAAMFADPVVMHDHPAPLTRAESDARFDRYAGAYRRLGFGRMALERADGKFLGLVGVMPIHETHAAAGAGVEIGWRMIADAWGHGYASEAAAAVLDDGFTRCGFAEVLSYTSPTNLRSQAVMRRLGMMRDTSRDFSYEAEGVRYDNVVFVARPDGRAAT
ncbi:MAG TPA: GNAT family N-acetyltransferase [Caulobacteraceae bacterium]|nr:GNAT family N-acetyltransferase [Caulobacteraceae bacterium]